MKVEKTKRLYSLDIFRIISAFFVFLFHAKIHINVDFGIFNNFIEMSNIFMVAFFMLSGFSLYYSNYAKSNQFIGGGYKCMVNFIKKRFLNIFPLYIIVYFLFLIFWGDNISIIQNIAILPVEITMLQSVYDGSFSVLNNGGTWFVSCIFLCYILFPFFFQFIFNMPKKIVLILCFFLYTISSYSFINVWLFKFSDIYQNPFFRIIEFFIGMLIAQLYFTDKEKKNSRKYSLVMIVVIMVFVIVITVGVSFRIQMVQAYNFIAIPVFAVILYFSSRIENKFEIKYFKKVILFLSSNTYAFFLAQFFTWRSLIWLLSEKSIFENIENVMKFFIAFLLCCCITLIFHYVIENNIKRIVLARTKI